MSTDARAQKLWAVCEPGEDAEPVKWLDRFEMAGMLVVDQHDVDLQEGLTELLTGWIGSRRSAEKLMQDVFHYLANPGGGI